MKKTILVLLVAAATVAFAACGNSDEPTQAANESNDGIIAAAANIGTTTPEAQALPATAETQDAPESETASPEVNLAPAFANLASEAAHRLNATPFQVFSLLADSITHGTVNVDVRYGGPFGIRVEANLATNSQTQQHHTQLGLNYMGFVRIDADIFATTDSLAIRVPIFDNNFYGVTFSTLEEDLPAFLNNFGIELDDFAEIFDGLDMILDGIQLDADLEDWLEMLLPYVEVIAQFFDDFSVTAQTTQRDGVDVTRYEYSFAFELMYNMIEDLFDVVRADADTLAYLAMMDVTMRDISMMFDEILTALEAYNLENSTASLAFYVSQNDRLMYVELLVDTQQASTSATQVDVISLDFGASVYCDWVFSIETDTVVWSFSDIDNTYTNSIILTLSNPWGGYDTSVASSVWSTTTGDFTLSFSDDFGGTDVALSGQLTRNANGGFALRFAEGELEIIISGTPGTPNIPQVNIVNIDQWDMFLIEDVLDFVFELMMMLE